MHKTLENIKLIREYNQEFHFLDGVENDTIDETEVDQFLKWCNKKE